MIPIQKIIDKLIAEFMGNDGHLPAKRIKYHSSWKQLMLVVEKIESLESPVCISSNNCTIYECVNFDTTKGHYMVDTYAESKIEATFISVVKYIKWYNKKNETCQK